MNSKSDHNKKNVCYNCFINYLLICHTVEAVKKWLLTAVSLLLWFIIFNSLSLSKTFLLKNNFLKKK